MARPRSPIASSTSSPLGSAFSASAAHGPSWEAHREPALQARGRGSPRSSSSPSSATTCCPANRPGGGPSPSPSPFADLLRSTPLAIREFEGNEASLDPGRWRSAPPRSTRAYRSLPTYQPDGCRSSDRWAWRTSLPRTARRPGSPSCSASRRKASTATRATGTSMRPARLIRGRRRGGPGRRGPGRRAAREHVLHVLDAQPGCLRAVCGPAAGAPASSGPRPGNVRQAHRRRRRPILRHAGRVYSQGPDNTWRMFIIDVAGTRVVTIIEYFPGTAPERLAEAGAIVDSLEFTP